MATIWRSRVVTATAAARVSGSQDAPHTAAVTSRWIEESSAGTSPSSKRVPDDGLTVS